MFNLISISLLIAAMGGIVYIISNHLSEFSDKGENNEENGDGFQLNFKARIALWINQLPLDNVKSQSLSLTQKLLHRFRLVLLKTDNHLMKLIGKISEKDKTQNGNGNGNGAKKPEDAPDFWRNLSKKKEMAIWPEPPASEVKIELADVKNDEAVKKFFDIKADSENSIVQKEKNKKVVELLLPDKPTKKSARAKKSLK